jgi:hypothetical protein
LTEILLFFTDPTDQPYLKNKNLLVKIRQFNSSTFYTLIDGLDYEKILRDKIEQISVRGG